MRRAAAGCGAVSATAKKRRVRGGAKHVDLDTLWRSDLFAFAEHIGQVLSPSLSGSIRTVEGQQWRDALDFKDSKQLKFDEDVRWKLAEEILWLAAWGEEHDRRETDIQSGKLRWLRTSVGMSWKPNTNIVQASAGIPWRRRVCDLLEHPAIKEGVDSTLFPILLDLVKAALDDQAEAYRLRDKPDAEALQARQARDESSDPPEGMAGIVKRLEQYRDAKNAEGRSENARTGGYSNKKNQRSRGDKDCLWAELDYRLQAGSLPIYSGRPNQKKTADLFGNMPKFQDYGLDTIKDWVKEWADARGIGYKPSKKNKRTGKG